MSEPDALHRWRGPYDAAYHCYGCGVTMHDVKDTADLPVTGCKAASTPTAAELIARLRTDRDQGGLDGDDAGYSAVSTPLVDALITHLEDTERRLTDATKALDEVGAPKSDGMGALTISGRVWKLSGQWVSRHTLNRQTGPGPRSPTNNQGRRVPRPPVRCRPTVTRSHRAEVS